MTTSIIHGDCLEVLAGLEADNFHACVTDPPYHLIPAGLSLNSMAHKARQPNRIANPSGFMGASWDGGDVAFRPETWAAVLRVLKPGGHLLAFGGTRTFHRLACAIEDAGFEIRDCILWLTGQGFPKSLDVSKQLDRAAGAEREIVGRSNNGVAGGTGRHAGLEDAYGFDGEYDITVPATEPAREWQGWGTALKPAVEMVCVARKPSAAVASSDLHALTGWDHWCSVKSDGEDKILTGRSLHSGARSYRVRIDKNGREVAREDLGAYETFVVDAVAANVLRHGTGALNIDASRVAAAAGDVAGWHSTPETNGQTSAGFLDGLNDNASPKHEAGRWPANVCHSGEPEVMDAFARFGERPTGAGKVATRDSAEYWQQGGGGFKDYASTVGYRETTGTAARFFFCAKADASERVGSHPTVKPIALMEWLVRLVTPPNGRVLDPFAGTGSTLVACDRLGFDAVGIEQDAQTVADAHEKLRRMRARRMIGAAERASLADSRQGILL